MRIPVARLASVFGLATLALAASATLGAGCGGTPKAYIPVDSPILPWEPAEGTEAAAEEGTEPAAEPAAAPAPATP